MARRSARLLALLGLAVSACAPAAAPHVTGAGQAGRSGGVLLAAAPRLSLQAAMRQGRDLGPVAPGTVVHLEASLAGRDTAALDLLTARGVRVSNDEYARRFAPTPQAGAAAQRALAAQGLTLAWTSGDQLAALDGGAAAVQRVFAVALHDFSAPDG